MNCYDKNLNVSNFPSVLAGTIHTRWEFVTPEKAQAWLLKNHTRNRPMYKRTLSRYSNDVTSGQWVLTHQGIGFTASGILVDGQHRLTSIVDSGVGLWMLVTRGLPESSIECVDRNRIRTLANALHILGYEMDHKRVAAFARVMWRGPAPIDTDKDPSDATLRRFIDTYTDALLFAQQHVPWSVGRAVLGGALARAYYHVEPQRLSRFILAMRDEIPTGEMQPGDKTARRLWQYLESMRSRRSVLVMNQYRKTQFAIRAYLEGKDVPAIREAEADLFPLPRRDQAETNGTVVDVVSEFDGVEV